MEPPRARPSGGSTATAPDAMEAKLLRFAAAVNGEA
jgi:hypothetical protein